MARNDCKKQPNRLDWAHIVPMCVPRCAIQGAFSLVINPVVTVTPVTTAKAVAAVTQHSPSRATLRTYTMSELGRVGALRWRFVCLESAE